MQEGMKGVLIRSVYPCSHAYGKLHAGDILLSFDGVQVACDGTVPFRTGERIAFGEPPRVGRCSRPGRASGQRVPWAGSWAQAGRLHCWTAGAFH